MEFDYPDADFLALGLPVKFKQRVLIIAASMDHPATCETLELKQQTSKMASRRDLVQGKMEFNLLAPSPYNEQWPQCADGLR